MVWNARHADVVTVMSPSYRDEIRQRWGIDSETIIGGVNTRLFKPGGGKEMRARLGIEPSEPVVGFIGSLERWYAIDEMIRALPKTSLDHPVCALSHCWFLPLYRVS